MVIGAGQAGFAVSAKLRRLGHQGPITLIGDEDQPPYQRPPLTKAYLLGEMALERLYFRPATFFADKNITLRTEARAEKILRDGKTVMLQDGTSLPYDKLVLTTGSRPVVLPASIGGALDGVYYIRKLADTDAVAKEFQKGRRLLVIGGGYIGLEAAAAAAKCGVSTTLVEAAPRILQRVAAPETSDFFRALHREHGVEIREGTSLARLDGDGDRVNRAELSDDTTLTVDFVIVGIGIRPNSELAEACGLDVENGIKVDATCRTSDPDILAAGDCASFPYDDARIRLESVGNAIDQAEAAAEVIMGQDKPYVAKPWFWSEQFDTKLQIAGLSTGYDSIMTRHETNGAVSFWYYGGDRLLAVDAMNNARAYMVARRLIESGQSPDPALIADPETDLKALLKG